MNVSCKLTLHTPFKTVENIVRSKACLLNPLPEAPSSLEGTCLIRLVLSSVADWQIPLGSRQAAIQQAFMETEITNWSQVATTFGSPNHAYSTLFFPKVHSLGVRDVDAYTVAQKIITMGITFCW
jgi:hypothetical protein